MPLAKQSFTAACIFYIAHAAVRTIFMQLLRVLLAKSMSLCHPDIHWMLNTGVDIIGTTDSSFYCVFGNKCITVFIL